LNSSKKKNQVDISMVQEKKKKKTIITKDNETKWFIRRNLGDPAKDKIDFKYNTTHQIWELLKSTNRKNDE